MRRPVVSKPAAVLRCTVNISSVGVQFKNGRAAARSRIVRGPCRRSRPADGHGRSTSHRFRDRDTVLERIGVCALCCHRKSRGRKDQIPPPCASLRPARSHELRPWHSRSRSRGRRVVQAAFGKSTSFLLSGLGNRYQPAYRLMWKVKLHSLQHQPDLLYRRSLRGRLTTQSLSIETKRRRLFSVSF